MTLIKFTNLSDESLLQWALIEAIGHLPDVDAEAILADCPAEGEDGFGPYCMPRTPWASMPGGVPYVTVYPDRGQEAVNV